MYVMYAKNIKQQILTRINKKSKNKNKKIKK